MHDAAARPPLVALKTQRRRLANARRRRWCGVTVRVEVSNLAQTALVVPLPRLPACERESQYTVRRMVSRRGASVFWLAYLAAGQTRDEAHEECHNALHR